MTEASAGRGEGAARGRAGRGGCRSRGEGVAAGRAGALRFPVARGERGVACAQLDSLAARVGYNGAERAREGI
jgi:hypothetical protein